MAHHRDRTGRRGTGGLPFIKGSLPWLEVGASAVGTDGGSEETEAPTSSSKELPEEKPAPVAFDVPEALRLIRDTLTQLQDDNDRLSDQLDDALTRDVIPVPGPSAGGAELERLGNQLALVDRASINALEAASRANRYLNDHAGALDKTVRENERLRDQVRLEHDWVTGKGQVSREIEATDLGPAFLDPADQFRHEVYLEWLARIPAASKAAMPLPEYGNTWRVPLQVKTASARRLHFWRGTDGKVTFATVGVHDDMGI